MRGQVRGERVDACWFALMHLRVHIPVRECKGAQTLFAAPFHCKGVRTRFAALLAQPGSGRVSSAPECSEGTV